MPGWLPKLLRRVHQLAALRRVRFTLKATRELAAISACLDEDDGCDILAALKAADSAGRLQSESTG